MEKDICNFHVKFYISAMNECFLLILLVFFISCSLTDALTITSPGLQRKQTGESCKLQWTVTGTFTNYTIDSLSNGRRVPLIYDYRTNTTFDRNKGVITLLIWNIQLSDAGDYQLHLQTRSPPDLYSVGTLFVYAVPSSPQITLVSGPNPGKEGDNYEMRCDFESTSEPAEYRTKVYYSWVVYFVFFKNISSGPAVTVDGDVVPRFTIKNDGSTLVVTSAQYGDNCVACMCQEEGSSFKTPIPKSLLLYYFDMLNPPHTAVFNPPSRKLTVSSYSGTITFMKFISQPPITSYTNWSFVSSNGTSRQRPVPNDPFRDNYVNLQVIVNSAESYGNYSITLTNIHGSTTETLQVLPPGLPDAPSKFTVQYVTHNIISLHWHCMWFNGSPQTVFVRLIEVANKKEIDTLASGPDTNCYNSVIVTVFRHNLQPDTQYQAIIWSSNQLGSSDEQSLVVRTKVRTSINVSCENISITEHQAVVNIRTSNPEVVWLNVTACVEPTGECVVQSYTLSYTNPVNQIVVNNLPPGINYIFDFTLFNGNFYNYVYLLEVLKGVRVSRTTPCANYDHKPGSDTTGSPLSVTTITLVVLFGVAFLVSIGIHAGFLIWKHHQRKWQSRYQQLPSLPEPSESTAHEMLIDDISDDNYDTINYYLEPRGSSGGTYWYEEVDYKDVERVDHNGINKQTDSGMSCPSMFEDHDLLLA